MKDADGRWRVVISNIQPQVEEGNFPIKRVLGEDVCVRADIFCNGHSSVAANLFYRHHQQRNWHILPMEYVENDVWEGEFTVNSLGTYEYTIHAWVDDFASWQKDLIKKFQLEMNIEEEIKIGINLLEEALRAKNGKSLRFFLNEIKNAKSNQERVIWFTEKQLSTFMRNHPQNQKWITVYPRIFFVTVDRVKARYSQWYEIFPRSFGPSPHRHGTFKDCIKLLPGIAKMGFDVLYFPPIHPIGYKKRKGKRSAKIAENEDVGSPWAIGSHHGGHDAVHPQLGSIKDFEALIARAKKLGIDIAMDLAFQCSLDHPYLKSNPDWFSWRSDGTIQYAENPPKKYEDIVPFYFETEDWKALWKELRSIVVFWIRRGIKIFRVDNPHTKPFPFWEWLLGTIKQEYPEVIFLSEAFTRPKVMYWLAKLGFTQSYTYFTWRHTKKELTEYITEIALSDVKEYFRPNLWTNTPDILTEALQRGGRPIFISRLVLAATLSSNYGMYAPAFEQMESEAEPETEEYLHSEKYQLRWWKRPGKDHLIPFITKLNAIRRKYLALQYTSNIEFLEIDNTQILYYAKYHEEQSLLVLVNLDPYHGQSGTFRLPLKNLQATTQGSFYVHELLSERQYIWEGETQNVTLDLEMPACILSLQKNLKSERDFGYYN